MVGPVRRRRRDRPARLVRRADDLHVVGLPHRQAVPRAARRPLRPPLPRPRAGHRRPRLRRPLRRHRELPRPATRPGSGWSSWCRGSWTAAPASRRRRRTTATCSTSSCRSRTRTASLHFSADIITGMFISMMFAGHHTTSGTAAWTLIELLAPPRRTSPRWSRSSTASRPTAPRSATRRCGRCRSWRPPSRRRCGCTRRSSSCCAWPRCRPRGRRLHDPAGHDGGGVSPSVSNRDPEAFADAEAFDPDRYLEPREDDVANPWSWIPFGAGRHRCVGAAFAMMQLKAIFSVLLQDWTLRADPAARHLPQRPLEDGRAARPALRRPDDPR